MGLVLWQAEPLVGTRRRWGAGVERQCRAHVYVSGEADRILRAPLDLPMARADEGGLFLQKTFWQRIPCATSDSRGENHGEADPKFGSEFYRHVGTRRGGPPADTGGDYQ